MPRLPERPRVLVIGKIIISTRNKRELESPAMQFRTLIFLAAALGLVALVWFLSAQFPDALNSDVEQAHLVRALAILTLIGSGIIFVPRSNLKGAAKNVAIWILLGAGVLAVYTLRDDFAQLAKRMGGEIVPSSGQQQGENAITVQRGRDGHFKVSVDVNGTPVRFLIDTGASIVTLSPDDAVRVGFDPSTLDYVQRFSTANGTAFGAPVRLDRLKIGNIRVDDVRGAVLSDGSSSLLGMSFLSRLSSYRVDGDTMTLVK